MFNLFFLTGDANSSTVALDLVGRRRELYVSLELGGSALTASVGIIETFWLSANFVERRFGLLDIILMFEEVMLS